MTFVYSVGWGEICKHSLYIFVVQKSQVNSKLHEKKAK